MAKYWSERNQEEEEEEEEALSLSDLPINLVKIEETRLIRESEDVGGGEGARIKEGKDEEPEFDFGWWANNGQCGSLESHMCAADELFFRGQILPRRLSISSDIGLVRRSMSRSESMDHGSASRLTGSRSSSIGSYHSHTSSSSSTYSSSATTRVDHHKRPFRSHRFHVHQSPRPQSINASSGHRQASLRSSQNNGRSSLWDLFRTGLVRGPAAEIELRDLKFRSFSNNKRNSAISRNNSGGGDSNAKSNPNPKRSRQGLLLNKNNIGGLLGGVNCKCSVETVPLNAPSKKMGPFQAGSVTVRKSRTSGADERLPKDSKTKEKMMMMKQKQAAMSQQRTCEWLKELSLSHAS